jgi:hypothetical protein
MRRPHAKLRRGDLVEVKAPGEILETLDTDSALNNLPFMPEMIQYCGKRFLVSGRALTTCFSGPGPRRGFMADDVVTLDAVRCSGTAHDGCQKSCTIYWREAWLRKVDAAVVESEADLRGIERLQARLRISISPNIYYCQASELSKVTAPLRRWEKLRNYLSGLLAGNFNLLQMAKGIGIWLFWRFRRIFGGLYPRGSSKSTPSESLNLQPGEWVEVKSIENIITTLDERGLNRGLFFSPDMRLLCGQRHRVKGRLDQIIVDGTGAMRQLRNTVCLEGSTCGCAYMGFGMGGCSRRELVYWREIWLRRADGPSGVPASER